MKAFIYLVGNELLTRSNDIINSWERVTMLWERVTMLWERVTKSFDRHKPIIIDCSVICHIYTN